MRLYFAQITGDGVTTFDTENHIQKYEPLLGGGWFASTLLRLMSCMCVRVYIQSDSPLIDRIGVRGCSLTQVEPLPSWKSARPAFPFAAEFAIGGCGCALIAEVAHGHRAGSGSPSPHKLLAEVLARLLSDGRRVQLLAAWAGRESEAAPQRAAITVSTVAEGRLPLTECIDGPPLRVAVISGA
jgi:hypothetical protein